MSDTVTIPRDRWERVRAAAQMWDGRVIGSDVPYALPEPGDLDDIPATTERHSVEAMIDELVGQKTVAISKYAVQVIEPFNASGTEVEVDLSGPDWRAALRAAYEQAVGQADGGERG